MGLIQEFCVNARPNYKTYVFCWKCICPCKRVQPHMFSFTNQKKVTWRGRGAGVKNKSKGLDLFLAEFLWMIFKGWPHRKKIASPGQPSIDRKWWDKLKNFVPMRGHIAKQAFFPEDTFVHAKGLRIAVGICRTALVKPWTLKNCELSAGKSGARNSFFSVSDWGGGRYGMLPTQASRIFFLLGYQRGKFIVCWTLGTRKLAKKIQKGGWKWDFGFRG